MSQGICSSGMMALKNAYLQVAIGEKRTAVTVASELASRGLKRFPAHYSSERMKTILLDELERRGIWAGRPEMWFSNLTRVGNIGSASIFVILDEMMTEGMIEPGDTLLCMVPESGRFAVSFMHLTAVSAPEAG
ncbi:3-oxoacyl-[acyl-carrier-protein] synthase III C-terminal domain-containing protein [Nocardia sp. NPDC046763]|uniref:3-oxoacyl-[acyl-carrier-protein] synthase III C-terminal domain-containing protein n=1 Tax=Nocardia sp. NPDC046763 TaxID=3155256 RepID=UPI0033ECE1F2